MTYVITNPNGIYSVTLERLYKACEAYAADLHDLFARIEYNTVCAHIREDYGLTAYCWAQSQLQVVYQAQHA